MKNESAQIWIDVDFFEYFFSCCALRFSTLRHKTLRKKRLIENGFGCWEKPVFGLLTCQIGGLDTSSLDTSNTERLASEQAFS